jgi:hypothetical protein
MFDKHTGALAAWLVAAFLLAMPPAGRAEIKDYEFQLAQAEVKKGDGDLAVRLVDKRNGKAVPDAVIYAKRIDMAPDGMPTMAAPIDALPATEPGVYRFKVALSMAGNWQLSLSAKVQGEAGTLEAKLPIKALP